MHAISDNAVSPQPRCTVDRDLSGRRDRTQRRFDHQSVADPQGRCSPVVTEGVEIAKVTEPGAVFSEHSAWLGQPRTADVHALEESKLYVVSTAAPLMQNPVAVSCVAAVVQRREASANRAQAELRRQVQDGQLSSITRKTIDKIEELLGASGGNLVYGGYPYDPFVLDT